MIKMVSTNCSVRTVVISQHSQYCYCVGHYPTLLATTVHLCVKHPGSRYLVEGSV
jgi:hypothetical protein